MKKYSGPDVEQLMHSLSPPSHRIASHPTCMGY